MKKPSKKKIRNFDTTAVLTDPSVAYHGGYNCAIDDYEEFLPGVLEIIEILDKVNSPTSSSYVSNSEMAIAISKRLKGVDCD